MGYFDKTVIREFFSAEDLIVGEIDLDEDEYIANVFIEVNIMGVYLPAEIMSIVKKIEKMETLLVEQGFIHDIKFGDLYNGNWRIIVHFLNDDEIKKWEEDTVKAAFNKEIR
jgi:hypothetical protein